MTRERKIDIGWIVAISLLATMLAWLIVGCHSTESPETVVDYSDPNLLSDGMDFNDPRLFKEGTMRYVASEHPLLSVERGGTGKSPIYKERIKTATLMISLGITTLVLCMWLTGKQKTRRK